MTVLRVEEERVVLESSASKASDESVSRESNETGAREEGKRAEMNGWTRSRVSRQKGERRRTRREDVGDSLSKGGRRGVGGGEGTQ